MVGYLLEVLFDQSPFRATMQIRRPPSAAFPQALASISGYSSDESESRVDAPAKGRRMDVTTRIPQTILAVWM
jgi:hypothetical protein